MGTPSIDLSLVIDAPAVVVVRAFFETDALRAWWGVSCAFAVPRTLAPYALQWPTTEFRDDVLGRLGGIFTGTVMQVDESRGFFVANAHWLPPDGDPIGPMAFEVACATPKGRGFTDATELRMTQRGFEKSERWRRYYQVIGAGYDRALHSLKALLDRP